MLPIPVSFACSVKTSLEVIGHLGTFHVLFYMYYEFKHTIYCFFVYYIVWKYAISDAALECKMVAEL